MGDAFTTLGQKEDAGPLAGEGDKGSGQEGCFGSGPRQGEGAVSTLRLSRRSRRGFRPDDLGGSVCSVVGHLLMSVELSFQRGHVKRCFDAVADGLQPTGNKTGENKCHFFSRTPLLGRGNVYNSNPALADQNLVSGLSPAALAACL